MSAAQTVDRDERTVSVENASYRWAYLLLSFALLVDVALRSFLYREAAWDLLGLVVAGGAVTTAYQAGQRVLTRRWAGRSCSSSAWRPSSRRWWACWVGPCD
jgi:hypothetical protein